MMNLPNLLSLSRVLAVFVLAGLLTTTFPFAATVTFVVFTLAALTDGLDGWVARRYNQITTIGKFLDALVDKIFVIGLLIVLLEFQRLHPLCLGAILLILTREFLVTGLRILAAERAVVIAAEKGGKIKTALQMVALGIPLMGSMLVTDFSLGDNKTLAGFIYAGSICLALATVQTVWSGCQYFVNYAHLLKEAPLKEAPQ